MTTRVLVVASTFPARDADPVPAFVRDQVIALATLDPTVEYHVLAPHDRRSGTRRLTRHAHYTEYRFHYFVPRRLEILAGRGILPTLKQHKAAYVLVPFFVAAEFAALLRLTWQLRPSLLYAHWFTPQALNAQWVGQLTRTPFAFTTHASDVDIWRRAPVLGGALIRANARRAQRITAVSQRSLARLRQFFSPTEWNLVARKVAIIPMGVELPSGTTPAREHGAASREILFIGRLAEKKGVTYLLRAFAEAAAELPGWRLTVAGDGPLLEDVRMEARGLGIAQRTSFVGYVTGEDKRELLRRATVYAVPSIITDAGDAEGLPVSLMEGLAYGKVCVATFESGADDILTDGHNGFLVPQRDPGALAAALVRAAHVRGPQREAITSAARETARSLSWPLIAERYRQFLIPGGRSHGDPSSPRQQ